MRDLKVVDSCRIFFENRVWYFQKCFDEWKGARISKNNVSKSYKKNSPSWEGLTVETRFLDMEKSDSKKLFSDDSKWKTFTRG